MDNGSSTDRVLADLRARAAAGRPGALLPSTRDLVSRHGVGPVTVSRAIARLAAEGVVVTEPGRGTFVAGPPAGAAPAEPADFGWQTVALRARAVDSDDLLGLLAPPDPGTYALSSGYPDPVLQPTRALADALARAGRRPGAWGRSPLSGVPELRAALAGIAGIDPADVLVVPGGQAGISTVLRALVPPGGAIVVESPTYLGLLTLARHAGLRPVPVPGDADGLRPDLLAEALTLSGARLVCCQPTFANPTGALWPARRRAEVLEVVRAAGAFLLEDDFARLLPLSVEPAPPIVRTDPDGHVVHLTSLTKVAAPSLRIGALTARGPAAARLRSVRAVHDFFVPVPLQEAAVELMASAAWRRHLVALRRALTTRRDALVAALRASGLPVHLAGVPQGGLHLWLRLPDHVDDRELARRCARLGLLVSAGTPYHPGEPPAPYLRLSYSGEPPERLAAGVDLLARAWRDLARPAGRAG